MYVSIREYINPGKFARFFQIIFRVDRFPTNDLKETCKLTRIYVLAYAQATSLRMGPEIVQFLVASLEASFEGIDDESGIGDFGDWRKVRNA